MYDVYVRTSKLLFAFSEEEANTLAEKHMKLDEGKEDVVSVVVEIEKDGEIRDTITWKSTDERFNPQK